MQNSNGLTKLTTQIIAKFAKTKNPHEAPYNVHVRTQRIIMAFLMHDCVICIVNECTEAIALLNNWYCPLSISIQFSACAFSQIQFPLRFVQQDQFRLLHVLNKLWQWNLLLKYGNFIWWSLLLMCVFSYQFHLFNNSKFLIVWVYIVVWWTTKCSALPTTF